MSVERNPKDSVKSDWWTNLDRSQWTIFHWFYKILDIYPTDADRPVPVHDKTEKVPYLPEWHLERWVIFHSAIPLILHQLYVTLTGRNFTALQAFFFYSISFKLIAIRELQSLRNTGHQTGFLDGDTHLRDGVPNIGVRKVAQSLVSTSTFRPVFTVMLSYRADKSPADINWLALLLEASLYGVILDFWFYWYHRLMHEVPSLWKYHRTHHLTKHPNPLLTLYADFEQEFFDIAGVPLATYFTMRAMGMPMGFYEWWVCQQYVVFTELAGHSGLRLHAVPPSPINFLLQATGTELIIEDHDLHHRKGWKKSGNYGKQTRVWDKVFGTCTDRIECKPENIDFDNAASMPLFW